MEALECINKRKSVRRYKNTPVEWEKIANILEAGNNAPSAGNLQNWKFVVIMDKSKRLAIAEACLNQLWMQDAPVHIIVCAEPDKSAQMYGLRGEKLYCIQNCAAATQNMLLAATAQGLGACWVGAFDEPKLAGIVGIPDGVRPQSIVTVGYAGAVTRQPQKLKIDIVVYLESFGNKIKDLSAYMGYTSDKVQALIAKGKEILGKIAGNK